VRWLLAYESPLERDSGSGSGIEEGSDDAIVPAVKDADRLLEKFGVVVAERRRNDSEKGLRFAQRIDGRVQSSRA
jgi:hypothetical protein